ncbi:MAG: DUF6494 family protein [Chromatiales bacterium]
MNEDTLNMQTRKFLKEVGVTSQRAIEVAVHEAEQAGKLAGRKKVAATMTLNIPDLGLHHEVKGDIAFE